MVTVAVVSVTLTIGIPYFGELIARNKISTQTNEFIAGLNLARSEAVRRAQPVTLRAKSNDSEFGPGWEVFTDADADGDKPGTVTASDGTTIRALTLASSAASVKRVTRSGSGSSVTYAVQTSSVADRMYLTFDAKGANAAGPSHFRVCDQNRPSVKGRIVEVSAVGRVSVIDPNFTCPSS